MPTYQYACTDCGHGFEAVQSFSDDSLTVCPSCEGRLRKIFNAVGVVFKGSGFYRNDSRAKDATNGKDAAENGKTSDSSTSSADATKDSSGSAGASSSQTSASTGSTKSSGSDGSAGKPKSTAGAA